MSLNPNADVAEEAACDHQESQCVATCMHAGDGDNASGTKGVPASERVPLVEKVAFSVGGIAGSLQSSAENSLLNPVFVLGYGISPALLSMLGMIYRFVDAVFDMVVGWVSDRTRTRWGRRRPYIFVGAILGGLWIPVIWFFGRNWSQGTIILWMASCMLVLLLLNSIWNIPFQCMLLEMTPNSNERTNVAAWRGYLGWVGWLLMAWSWRITQLPIFHNAVGKPDVVLGARWLTIGFAVIAIALGVLPAIFGRERYYKAVLKEGKVPFIKNFELTFANKPFMLLSAFTLLFFIGANLKGGLAFYTRLTYVCGGDQALASTLSGIEGTITIFIGLLGYPVFQWMANRYSKRTALFAVMGIMFLASISTIVTYIPSWPYLSMFSGILLAPANAALWMLIPSMTGDIVDHDELQTSERREGAFAAVFSWIYKIAVSLGGGLSGALVVWAGFDAGHAAAQPTNVIWTMRVLLVVVPAVFILASVWILFRYPLTPHRMTEIRVELEARRGTI